MALKLLSSKNPVQTLVQHIESFPFIDNHYFASRFKGLKVSSKGLDVIKGSNGENEAFFQKLLLGSLRRMQDIWKMYDEELKTGIPNYSLGVSRLDPHIDLGQKLVSSEGSQGSVWRFPSVDDFIFKFYHNNADFEEHGFNQFNALLNKSKGTVFKTPTPYFATPHVCAMSSFPSKKDYWNFISDNPKEEKQLSNYLLYLAYHDPLNCDLGDILAYYDGSNLEKEMGLFKGGGSVFILDFDSSKKKSSERYSLGTVDVSDLDFS